MASINDCQLKIGSQTYYNQSKGGANTSCLSEQWGEISRTSYKRLFIEKNYSTCSPQPGISNEEPHYNEKKFSKQCHVIPLSGAFVLL